MFFDLPDDPASKPRGQRARKEKASVKRVVARTRRKEAVSKAKASRKKVTGASSARVPPPRLRVPTAEFDRLLRDAGGWPPPAKPVWPRPLIRYKGGWYRPWIVLEHQITADSIGCVTVEFVRRGSPLDR